MKIGSCPCNNLRNTHTIKIVRQLKLKIKQL